MPEEWVTMSEASATLKSEGMNVSLSKLSRLANTNKIKSDSDPLDQRTRLVDLGELRALFSSSKRLKRETTTSSQINLDQAKTTL